jgi:putative DNA primase/helicase
MIYAKRGVGKTFVSLEISFAVASGSNMFCGKWKVSIQRKVLFIDGEMPLETIKQRLLSIAKRNANYNPENLIIINPEVQEEGMPDLATKEGQTIINDYISEDTKLVVIDNLSTLCRTGRENESESWIIIQDWILSLRRRGIAVLMVHHAGKNGEQRGNSKKEDILDTVINLKKPQDYNQSEGARFEVVYEKSRNFTGDEAKSFEAVLTENGFEIKDLELGIEAKVLELHSMNISQREIAKELGVSLSKVNRIINKK